MLVAYLLINKLVKKYECKQNSIEKALLRGTLKGHKNPEGLWLIDEKDYLEYRYGPDLHEWVRLKEFALWFNIPQNIAYNLRDTCDFEWKKFKGEIFVKIKQMYDVFEKEGLLKHADIYSNPCVYHTKVWNKKGIHVTPSTLICETVEPYFPETRLSLVSQKGTWHYCPINGIADLLELKCEHQERIEIHTCGFFKSDLAKTVFDMFEDKFGLEN